MFHQKQKIRHRISNHLSLTVVALLLEFALTMPAAQWQAVERHLPAAAASLTPVGQLADTNRLHLAIALPLRNQDVLSNLLQELYDPASPNYHHYLMPDQFTEQFGPTAADYEAVIAFAKANGLPVEAIHPNRVLLDVSGTVAEVQRALHITVRTYRHPTENRTFFAPDTAPTLDLAAPILGISGLNNYSLPRPYFKAKPLISGAKAVANLGSGLGGTFQGKDFRAAYLPGTTLDGSGQVVGLLEMDGYTAGDITYYESQAGLTNNVPLSNVLLDGFNGSPTGNGGEGEVSLDIEMAISMAPNLSQVIVYEAGPSGNWHDLLNRMATDNLASQISSSWGSASSGIDAVADQIWQQMAAQGQSFFQASGDKDAYTGAIPFPNDSPYITQVGGTVLTTSGPGGYWVSEKVWNQASGDGSGGGISTSYSIPSWQAKLNMTSNLGSKAKRNTPDVAMVADQVYVRADGFDYGVYGTSCAAPLWAGLTALANQQAAAAGQPAIGFINPAVYAIGTNINYAQSFHDITVGNNEWYGSLTKFPAVSGYDLCTGWGTPKGPSLINALANYGNFLITPAAGFSSAGKAGGPFSVTTQKFTLTNAGVTSINWTLANTSAWLKASPTSGTLTSGGAAATVTVSLNTAASNLVAGTYSATVWLTNLNNSVRQGRQFTLSVISPPVITMQPISQAVVEGGTAVFTVVSDGGISYQWEYNGTNLTDNVIISGSATTNLIISNVPLANAGNYSVAVSNVAGTVTSSNALLTVLPPLPASVQVSFVQSSSPKPGNYPQWVTAADVNGDGKMELISANSNDNTLSVLTNNGSGGFAVAYAYAVGNHPYSVVAADVNGDGKADLISANQSGNNLSVLTNNGSGGFVLASSPSTGTGSGPYQVTAADVNGDGKVDLISVNQANNTISVLTNNGSGGFVISGTYAVGNSPIAVAAADINGDGKVDLIVANVNDNTLSVLTNNGSGGFVLSSLLHVGTYPYGITAADVNGDGKVDLICANYGDNKLSVLTNNGSGNFVLASTPSVGTGPFGVTSADVNGDGKVDLICANLNSSTLSVLTNNGSGSFVLALSPNVGNGPQYVLAADVNGDGKVDLISANSYSSSLSVLTNATPFGPPSIPIITTQPTNQTVVAGGVAAFSVTASSLLPMSYQWTFNNTNLVGATNAALTLTGVATNQAGVYAVAITNQAGGVISSNAILSIYPSAVSLLNGVSFTAGNHLQFTVVGVPGFIYAVQASTNLMDWAWLITNTAPFNFTDTNNPGFQQQFYRTVYLP
jgi:hypothetical protein